MAFELRLEFLGQGIPLLLEFLALCLLFMGMAKTGSGLA